MTSAIVLSSDLRSALDVDRVDVVSLLDAPPELGRRIAIDGRIVYCLALAIDQVLDRHRRYWGRNLPFDACDLPRASILQNRDSSDPLVRTKLAAPTSKLRVVA